MLHFTNSGRHSFLTDLGGVGWAWTPAGVQRLVLDADLERVEQELERQAGHLDLRRRVQGDAARLVRQIKDHQRGKCSDFLQVPVDLSGMSVFSRKVLQSLRQVGPGQVTTYGELAARCGKPGAARAVGRIMGANPVPLLVPCHRCLGKNGALTGFSSPGGLDLKARLLFVEGYVSDPRYRAGVDHLSRKDKVMRRIIPRIGPYRALPDKKRPPWETLVTAIVHQQLSLKAGRTIAGRLRDLAPGEGFPTPAQILEVDPQALRAAGLSGSKVGYVRDLARKVADGELRLDRLKRLDDEAVISRLTEVRGIGRWSAQMHLMFHLGRLDVLPTADLGLQAAAGRAYGLGQNATEKQLEDLAEKWKPYRSLGSWYLWQGMGAGVI